MPWEKAALKLATGSARARGPSVPSLPGAVLVVGATPAGCAALHRWRDGLVLLEFGRVLERLCQVLRRTNNLLLRPRSFLERFGLLLLGLFQIADGIVGHGYFSFCVKALSSGRYGGQDHRSGCCRRSWSPMSLTIWR